MKFENVKNLDPEEIKYIFLSQKPCERSFFVLSFGYSVKFTKRNSKFYSIHPNPELGAFRGGGVGARWRQSHSCHSGSHAARCTEIAPPP